MPGNLEAPLILPEHAYDVKRKLAQKPLSHNDFLRQTTRRHRDGVKGAEGGEAHP